MILFLFLIFLFRLNDDWAYANEARSKSWDFQNEEAILKAAVEKFNSRRYSHLYSVFALGTNCIRILSFLIYKKERFSDVLFIAYILPFMLVLMFHFKVPDHCMSVKVPYDVNYSLLYFLNSKYLLCRTW